MALSCEYAVTALLLTAALSCSSTAQEVVLPKSAIALQQHIPDSILYGVLFRQAAAFYQEAAILDRQGKDGSPYRKHLAHKLNLSPPEELSLEEAGLLYNIRVKPIDAEIAESAARWRAGLDVVPQGHFPPLPPEAADLLAKRDAAIEGVRDSFHASIGDSEFARIDALVKTRIAASISQRSAH
jgi:hypothetical protein